MYSHMHKFKFDCIEKNKHTHKIKGCTEGMIGINNFHLHFFYGTSTYTNHTHYFSGVTGLPIKTENGHIHKMEGVLEMNNMHEHKYSGYTFEEVSYISGKAYGETYV